MLSASERIAIKKLIIPLAVQSHLSIRKQLSESIHLISLYDFPREWEDFFLVGI